MFTVYIAICCLKQTTVEFVLELASALQGQLDLSSLRCYEDEMVTEFVNPDPRKKWREGTQKCCFNYLLLDPRVTQNLPVRIKSIGGYLLSVGFRFIGLFFHDYQMLRTVR